MKEGIRNCNFERQLYAQPIRQYNFLFVGTKDNSAREFIVDIFPLKKSTVDIAKRLVKYGLYMPTNEELHRVCGISDEI